MQQTNYLYIEQGQPEIDNIKCCKRMYLITSVSLKLRLCIPSSEQLAASLLGGREPTKEQISLADPSSKAETRKI